MTLCVSCIIVHICYGNCCAFKFVLVVERCRAWIYQLMEHESQNVDVNAYK